MHRTLTPANNKRSNKVPKASVFSPSPNKCVDVDNVGGGRARYASNCSSGSGYVASGAGCTQRGTGPDTSVSTTRAAPAVAAELVDVVAAPVVVVPAVVACFAAVFPPAATTVGLTIVRAVVGRRAYRGGCDVRSNTKTRLQVTPG